MKISFDLDGVVVDIDLAMLRLMNMERNKSRRNELMKYYFMHRRMQLNPLDYLADGDELYFITGREQMFKGITEEWTKKYFPQATLIVVETEAPTDEEDWNIAQARGKAKVINQHNIDIHIDDNPAVVERLRKLCTNTIIIKYGARMKE